jgi:hypothetical protein
MGLYQKVKDKLGAPLMYVIMGLLLFSVVGIVIWYFRDKITKIIKDAFHRIAEMGKYPVTLKSGDELIYQAVKESGCITAVITPWMLEKWPPSQHQGQPIDAVIGGALREKTTEFFTKYPDLWARLCTEYPEFFKGD